MIAPIHQRSGKVGNGKIRVRKGSFTGSALAGLEKGIWRTGRRRPGPR